MMFTRNLDPKVAMGIGKPVSPKETREFVKNQLATNQTWAVKALVKIFEFQTKDEQEYERTSVNNKVGFTGADGEILASFAKQYMTRGFLTPKQMVLVHRKMPKYWSQIAKISDKDHLNTLIKKSINEKSKIFG